MMSGSVTTVPHQLDQPLHGSRVEEVHADHPTRASGAHRELGDRERRRVRREDDVGAAHLVQLARTRAVLSSRCSGTASTTRSASARSAIDVVVVIRASSASASSWVSLPRPTARDVEVSRWERPRATASSSISAAMTCRPLRANTSTMPAPIVPRPTTPTVRNSRAIPRSSQTTSATWCDAANEPTGRARRGARHSLRRPSRTRCMSVASGPSGPEVPCTTTAPSCARSPTSTRATPSGISSSAAISATDRGDAQSAAIARWSAPVGWARRPRSRPALRSRGRPRAGCGHRCARRAGPRRRRCGRRPRRRRAARPRAAARPAPRRHRPPAPLRDRPPPTRRHQPDVAPPHRPQAPARDRPPSRRPRAPASPRRLAVAPAGSRLQYRPPAPLRRQPPTTPPDRPPAPPRRGACGSCRTARRCGPPQGRRGLPGSSPSSVRPPER